MVPVPGWVHGQIGSGAMETRLCPYHNADSPSIDAHTNFCYPIGGTVFRSNPAIKGVRASVS